MTRASIFMTAGWIGLAGVAMTIAGSVVPEGADIATAGMVIAVLACWAMLFTRKADEYTQGLWTSAASSAFATLLILFVLLPFAEGFIDGLREAFDGPRGTQDIPTTFAITLAILAFYVGLFWKRLRGI